MLGIPCVSHLQIILQSVTGTELYFRIYLHVV
jgi:hypothetical protein